MGDLITEHLWAGFEIGFFAELGIYFSALFLICMVCHGELVRLRPPAKNLTEFYLCISAGGALGGLFVSLIAPQLFTTFFEWRIGLIGSFVLVFALAFVSLREWLQRRLQKGQTAVLSAAALVGVAAVGAIVNWEWHVGSNILYEARNFYGTVTVQERNKSQPEHYNYAFISGSIFHGRQYVDPARHRVPLAYYGKGSGAEAAFRFACKKPDARIGVVGLGVGTTAAYGERGQYFRFYEINPQVEHLARTYFTFFSDLAQRGATFDTVIADARLALEREEPQRFDLLMLDAFSGDSVPAHLLTKEAMEVYLRHLRDPQQGILCFHVTNSFLNLEPVVLGLARHFHLHAVHISQPGDDDPTQYGSDYIVLTNNAEFLAATPERPHDPPKPQMEVPLWTDSYSNIFRILVR